MKKSILWISAAFLLCIFLLTVYSSNMDIPMPDEILVYRNGTVQKLTQKDALFAQISSLIKVRGDSVQEMAIDPDTISEIKESLAVEYCYNEAGKIGNRTYSRLLFSLSGWTKDCVILYQDGEYQSGSYECKIAAKKLTTLMETLQK